MAIEIKITKELGNYEPKFIGPLTLRQVICLIIAFPAAYGTYRGLSPIISSDIAGIFCMLIGAIPCLFGWVKPYGMHTEKFLKSIFVNVILAPQKRKYKTVNTLEKIIKYEENLEKKEESENKRKKKDKTERYHLSPKAIK